MFISDEPPVYVHVKSCPGRTIAHLKNNIRDAIANVPIDMLQRMDTNFKSRLNQCMRNGGRLLPDVIFMTAWQKNWDLVFSNKTKYKTITYVRFVFIDL